MFAISFLYIMDDVFAWRDRISATPSLQSLLGEGIIVRDDALNRDIKAALQVLPPLYGEVHDTDEFVAKATAVVRSAWAFYTPIDDAHVLQTELDDDELPPASLKVLPVTTPVKVFQLFLILVCLRRIKERAIMLGHGEHVDDEPGGGGGGGGGGGDDGVVAALREELHAERERSKRDREEFKNQFAQQAKTMTEQIIAAIAAGRTPAAS